jgi:hypothetical protein
MNDNIKPSFEPFITVSLASVRSAYSNTSTTKIALASNAPGCTAIHMYDAPAARRLVGEINNLIAVLDPPPQAAAAPAPAKRRLPVKRKLKGKR